MGMTGPLARAARALVQCFEYEPVKGARKGHQVTPLRPPGRRSTRGNFGILGLSFMEGRVGFAPMMRNFGWSFLGNLIGRISPAASP